MFLNLLAFIYVSASAMSAPLLQNAAIIGDVDPRVAVSKSHVGLSPSEIEQSRTSLGMINCPGIDKAHRFVAVGTIVLAKDILVTVAHVFVGDDGKLNQPLTDCYFVNSKNPTQRHYIVLEPGKFTIGMFRSVKDAGVDFAMARLNPPVSEATPYAVDTTDVVSRPGRKYTVFTNTNEYHKYFGSEPKVQSCNNTAFSLADDFGHHFFTSDCSAESGDSGGPNFVRSPDGTLELKGMIISVPLGASDYCTADNGVCSTKSIEAVGPFLETLLNFAQPRARE